ncbi:MAG: hypothetical protein ABI606_21120, partial [Rhodoferax sp.]
LWVGGSIPSGQTMPGDHSQLFMLCGIKSGCRQAAGVKVTRNSFSHFILEDLDFCDIRCRLMPDK